MTTMTESPETTTLSAALRSGTRAEHEQAETMRFVEDLMSGRFGDRGATAYADLAVQLHAIYRTLEASGERVRTQEAGSAIVFDELTRTPAIEADLEFLLGPEWRAAARVLPATERYVARLEQSGDWVGGYAAHAYTRYLGDLSGGQVIKVMMQRHYGFGEDGLSFYTFAQIPKPKVFKDAYRDAIDRLPLSAGERERVVAEARRAFRFNQDVFAELGELHPGSTREG